MSKKKNEKLINNFNIEEICQLLDFDSKNDISELKLNDFLVDIRGNNKYNEKIELLKINVKTDIALKYIKEIEIINKIFVECARLQNKINSVPPKLVLPLILFWGSHNIDNYKTAKATQFLKENNTDTVVAYEKNTEMTIKAIKSLMYNEKLFNGDKFIHKFNSVYIFFSKYKYQKCIMEYIMNSYLVSHWLEKYDYWKKGIYTISIIDECTIKLNITDKELIQKKYKSLYKRKNRTNSI